MTILLSLNGIALRRYQSPSLVCSSIADKRQWHRWHTHRTSWLNIELLSHVCRCRPQMGGRFMLTSALLVYQGMWASKNKGNKNGSLWETIMLTVGFHSQQSISAGRSRCSVSMAIPLSQKESDIDAKRDCFIRCTLHIFLYSHKATTGHRLFLTTDTISC